MYTVDPNNVITRWSDGKRIVRDITMKDYQDYLFTQQYQTDPAAASIRVGAILDQRPTNNAGKKQRGDG